MLLHSCQTLKARLIKMTGLRKCIIEFRLDILSSVTDILSSVTESIKCLYRIADKSRRSAKLLCCKNSL